MAFRDYITCGDCETKIIYDGADNGRDRLEEKWGDPDADVWTVHLLCPDCIKKLQDDLAAARARLDSVAERDRLAIAAVEGVQQMRIDLAAWRGKWKEALDRAQQAEADIAAARALLGEATIWLGDNDDEESLLRRITDWLTGKDAT